MTCEFEDNLFCDSLDAEIRDRLCACCHRKSYARGTAMHLPKWANRPALQLAGVMLYGRLDDPSHPASCCTTSIAVPGSLISAEPLSDEHKSRYRAFHEGDIRLEDWSYYALTDITVALLCNCSRPMVSETITKVLREGSLSGF